MTRCNLFTAFGGPDIELCDLADGQVVVDLRGVDAPKGWFKGIWGRAHTSKR